MSRKKMFIADDTYYDLGRPWHKSTKSENHLFSNYAKISYTAVAVVNVFFSDFVRLPVISKDNARDDNSAF